MGLSVSIIYIYIYIYSMRTCIAASVSLFLLLSLSSEFDKDSEVLSQAYQLLQPYITDNVCLPVTLLESLSISYNRGWGDFSLYTKLC